MTGAYDKIPEHMREGMKLFIENGIAPGGFLLSVLANDLMGAVGRADSMNQHRLLDFARFIFSDAPSTCHGSYEVVNEWIMSGGLKGQEAKRAQDSNS